MLLQLRNSQWTPCLSAATRRFPRARVYQCTVHALAADCQHGMNRCALSSSILLTWLLPALQVANSYDEFDGQTVIDLGCGTVRLLRMLRVLCKLAPCRPCPSVRRCCKPSKPLRPPKLNSNSSNLCRRCCPLERPCWGRSTWLGWTLMKMHFGWRSRMWTNTKTTCR